MNRTPIKHRGKVTAHRERGMKDSAPVVCARAGGSWCGWSGDRCVGAQCEMVDEKGVRCQNYGWWYPLAHIIGRGQCGHEEPWNLANLCLVCHDRFDHGTAEERAATREKLQAIAAHVAEKNEREGQ